MFIQVIVWLTAVVLSGESLPTILAKVPTPKQNNTAPVQINSLKTSHNISKNVTVRTNTTTNVKCPRLMTSLTAVGGISQTCKPHDNCMGACCMLTLLAHNISYNFTVRPCSSPSVDVTINITDIKGAYYHNKFTHSDSATIPHGNLTSLTGFYETESSIEVVLEKVLDVTHFRLDFGVDYRVLESEPIRSLFSHTLVPMITIEYSKEVCVIPTPPPQPSTVLTEVEEKMLWGMIPEEYVHDKTALALLGTAIGLICLLLVALVYCLVTRKRSDGFRKAYVSAEENMHLTKGNDGFEPLDDSDID